MNRFLAVVAFFTIFLAACGVERDSDETLAAEPEETSSETTLAPDDATDGDGGTPSTAPLTTLPPATTPTTGPPNEVALTADFGDSTWEITHGELNEMLVATQENEEFVALVFGGVTPPGFDVGVLTQRLTSEAVQRELTAAGGAVTDADLETSRQGLLAQVESLYAGAADPTAEAERLFGEVPYLPFLVEYQAGQDALTALLSEAADPADGVPCVRHILVDSEAEAQDVVTRLDGGEDFGLLAIELSTGPSGPSGGDLGCAPSSGYVGPFAAAVDSAEVGAFVGPVETEFGWHVLTVDRFEVDGRTLAADRLRVRLQAASVEVDELLGSWDAEQTLVLPLGP